MYLDYIIDKACNNIIEYSMIRKGDKVLVGLSGGADSVFLLISLLHLKDNLGFDIAAAHVNHGIRGKSADEDCQFCAQLCKKYSVPFHSVHYDIPLISTQLKTSEENAGRIKRYQFFNELCLEYGYNKIAVAHNMNDSVETVIINMIRGSSLNGICGIKPTNNNVIRPIFNISREEIEKYLFENQIDYQTDETNLSNDYTRNKIRNQILELMKEINPSVVKTIFANTNNFREDDEYILSSSRSVGCITQNNNSVIIQKNTFDNQHVAIKKRIILDAFKRLKGNLENIEKKHIDILLGNLTSGKTYNMPDGVFVSVSFDQIVFSKDKKKAVYLEYELHPNTKIKFGDYYITTLIIDNFEKKDTDALYIDFEKLQGKLILRSKKDGDRFVPYGMNGSKKIKQFLSELKIPFMKKNTVPLLCDQNEIVAVIPYRINEHYKICENTTKVLKIQITKEI